MPELMMLIELFGGQPSYGWTSKDIKSELGKNFRELQRLFHPDKSQSEEATKLSATINQCWKVFSTPELLSEYLQLTESDMKQDRCELANGDFIIYWQPVYELMWFLKELRRVPSPPQTPVEETIQQEPEGTQQSKKEETSNQNSSNNDERSMTK